MRTQPATFALLAACAAFAACSRRASSTPSAVVSEGERIVSRHDITLTKPAGGPTPLMAAGPLLGNGDIGVMQSGEADQLTFYIGKNDFWSLRSKSPIAVGRLRLLIPALDDATFKTVSDMRLAEIRGEYADAKSGAGLASRAWVDANRNLLCVELTNTGSQPLEASLETLEGASGEPSDGSFLYAPDAPKPDGCAVGVCTAVVGHDSARALTLLPKEKAVVAVCVQSRFDAGAEDPLAAARALAGGLTADAVAENTAAHRQWWRDFWGLSFIEIPDKTIEQHWYSSLYVMGSCSRAGKMAPGLWGNWITTDGPAWHGDYHLNYNFEAAFYGLYAANHADATLPAYTALNDAIPFGQDLAAKRGWKGAYLPIGLGPKFCVNPYGDARDHGQRSCAAYAALLPIWYWQSTRDTQWLRTEGYPFLREVGLFWEDYLKLEDAPGGGQRYVIRNDSIHEGSGKDMNGLLSLGLVRTLFDNLVPMSEALGVDEDKRDKWRDITKRLSAFPTCTVADLPPKSRIGEPRTPEVLRLPIFRYTEQGTPWWDGNSLGIQHIFPAGSIGLDSDPKLLERSRNMIRVMGRWADYNASSSWYTACARVGYDPKQILAQLRRMYDRHSLPNNLLNFGGGGVENVAPSHAVTEMLMQSHEGVIRFFPCWPKNLDARFGGLRADGAFLVWAQLKSGKISDVKIVSEKGTDCAIVNPWPGKKAQVLRNGKAAETVEGERFMLKTEAGETIEIKAE